jgi:hypothetical protein
MSRISLLALVAALLAGLAGYLLGSAAPARAETHWEYKALSLMEFEVQGDKINGDEWVKPSHLDMPFPKVGSALIKDRAIMTTVLNGLAVRGWEPFMMYSNVIVVRRPAQK